MRLSDQLEALKPWQCRACERVTPSHQVHPSIQDRGTCPECELLSQPPKVRQEYAIHLTYLAALCNPAERAATA